ncbi:MAG: outer membrane protein assembly factor BamD, partial [Myxococcota bacterium]
MFARLATAALAALLLPSGCKNTPPTFEEPAPAEELYEQGIDEMEGGTLFGFIPWIDYGNSVETFQAIIDNYPYSDYAVLAELKIADSYFRDAKYEEALSYYRDFADLHPQHPE